MTLISVLRNSCSHSASTIQSSLFRGLRRFRLPPSYSMNAAPAFPNTPQTMLKLSRHITFGTSKAWFLCMMEGSCLIRVAIVHMASTANSFLLAVFHCLYGPVHPAAYHCCLARGRKGEHAVTSVTNIERVFAAAAYRYMKYSTDII